MPKNDLIFSSWCLVQKLDPAKCDTVSVLHVSAGNTGHWLYPFHAQGICDGHHGESFPDRRPIDWD